MVVPSRMTLTPDKGLPVSPSLTIPVILPVVPASETLMKPKVTMNRITDILIMYFISASFIFNR